MSKSRSRREYLIPTDIIVLDHFFNFISLADFNTI